MLEFLLGVSSTKYLKMKILLILIVGILIIGVATALITNIVNVDFNEKVLAIDTTRICQITILSNVISKCTKDTLKTINVDQNVLSITKNNKTGIIRVRNG